MASALRVCAITQEFIAGAMDRKRALTSETLTRVFSELDDDHDGELGPRVFASALQVHLCFYAEVGAATAAMQPSWESWLSLAWRSGMICSAARWQGTWCGQQVGWAYECAQLVLKWAACECRIATLM